jgi:hypothetical protein
MEGLVDFHVERNNLNGFGIVVFIEKKKLDGRCML